MKTGRTCVAIAVAREHWYVAAIVWGKNNKKRIGLVENCYYAVNLHRLKHQSTQNRNFLGFLGGMPP